MASNRRDLLGAKRLILKDQGLTKIPSETFSNERAKQATILELSKNRLETLPTDLKHLTELVILDASYNKLTKLPLEVATLPKLKKLVLDGNKFTKIPVELNQDQSIEQLLISRNHIEAITAETFIPHLRVLYASNNKIRSISRTFSDMIYLQEIHMKNNGLIDFYFVESLVNLHVLDLSHNEIVVLPDLTNHRQLLEVNLSYNRLTAIPFIRGACVLNVSNNQIEYLSVVTRTKVLQHFDLDSSQDGTDNADCDSNEYLCISAESINDSRLRTMGESLVVLNLAKNRISNIEGLHQIISLQELNLYHNQISEIPPKLFKLQKLALLNLGKNVITKLPKQIRKATQLKSLQLQGNQLNTLPHSLTECHNLWPKQGGYLNIIDNPLSLIPRAYRGSEKIFSFLSDLAKDSPQYFIRSRILVVGASGTGKTTLVRKLTNTYRVVQDGFFRSSDSTVGIQCVETQVQRVIQKKTRTISLCYWDFGGATEYKCAHAFFSSSLAQYIIAFNVLAPSSRSLCDWFNLIQTTAPGATVYIVGTHFKKANQKEVKAADDKVKQALADWSPAFFPKIKIVSHSTFSFWPVCNSLSKTWGTADIEIKLTAFAATKAKRIPRSYLHLMTQVVKQKQGGINVVKWVDYTALTEPFEFSERKLKRVTRLLHQWGFVFHFPDEVYAEKKLVIINPEWLMKLFASVIGVVKQQRKRAFVSENSLLKIWKTENFDDKEFKLMVDILKGFRIMILWKQEPKRLYLVPSLLGKNNPSDRRSSFEEIESPAAQRLLSCSQDELVTHFRVYGLPYTIPGLFPGLIVNLRKTLSGQMTCWKDTLIVHTEFAEIRISLDVAPKQLNIERGIHLHVKATSQEKCIEIVATMHWEISSLLTLSYECKLWEKVRKNTWVFYQGLWIKRLEILTVFNESVRDEWSFSGISGTLHTLLPELYALPQTEDIEFEGYASEIKEEYFLQKTAYGEAFRMIWNDGEEVFTQKIQIHHNCSWVSRSQTSFILDQFFTEVKVLSSLQHRNIVKFLTYFPYPPVLVQEYVPGGRLSFLLKDPERMAQLSWPLLIRIAHDVALGVQYLHNQTPRLVHGNLTMNSILMVHLDANSDQVAKLTDITINGNSPYWVDTAAYVSIIQELVDAFVKQVESGHCESAVDYAQSLLDDNTESESDEFLSFPQISTDKKLQGAIAAEVVYDTVSHVALNPEPGALMPHVVSNFPQHVVIPKVFQRIMQYSGRSKLPDFDQICSLFAHCINPEKTTELIQMRMENFAKQLTNTTPDSPPRSRKSFDDSNSD